MSYKLKCRDIMTVHGDRLIITGTKVIKLLKTNSIMTSAKSGR